MGLPFRLLPNAHLQDKPNRALKSIKSFSPMSSSRQIMQLSHYRYMTYGLTGFCHPVFRKVPSSNCEGLPSDQFSSVQFSSHLKFTTYNLTKINNLMMNFKGKLPIFNNLWQIFKQTRPYLRKIRRKKDP